MELLYFSLNSLENGRPWTNPLISDDMKKVLDEKFTPIIGIITIDTTK